LHRQQQMVATTSVPSEISHALGSQTLLPVVRWLAIAGVAVALLWTLSRVAHGADWIAGAGWATLALLLGTAWLNPWYVSWVLPLAGVAGDRRLCAATLAFSAFVVWTRVAHYI
jgi:hypothetical protein